jgi:hypothetical protein
MLDRFLYDFFSKCDDILIWITNLYPQPKPRKKKRNDPPRRL